MPLPDYYSSLSAFRETFLRGRPVLTYHHVGPRKRGAWLKGLYLSPKLFARQMAELRDAGFVTAPYGTIKATTQAGPPQVFLTFDDGFPDVLEHALPVLQHHHFCGIQFLVSDLLGKTNEWQLREGDVCEPLMDDAQVRDWLAAGQQIGSHTQTHPHLPEVPLAAAREQIQASKKSLEDRFGVPIEHFCYPYGEWNAAVRDLVIEAGYQTACTTAPGVNSSAESPFELKRFTARYRSRKLKTLWRSVWARD